MGSVVALALVSYAWGITGEGWGNLYYAASVRSMDRSWSGFFFGTFDPARLVTTDKPPLAFWIQVGFVRLFGYHGWVLLVPQALEGAATVLVLYLAVSRWQGFGAGLIAAVVLTVTPVVVAINRDNNPDTLLMLLLVGAAYTTTRALQSDRLSWLVATGVLVATASVAKSLTAWMILPAVGGAYLLCGPSATRRRALRLAALGAVVAVGTLAWPALVDLTPASQRPYVEGSAHDSELELTFVTNGLDRLVGSRRPAHPTHRTAGQLASPATPTAASPAGSGSLGARGPLRLLTGGFGGQIGWLLPLAGLASASGLWVAWRRRHPAAERGGWILWAVWLGTAVAVISFGGGVSHLYYANEAAPQVAATVGAGTVLWIEAWRRGQALGWLLPAAIGGSALAGYQIAQRAGGSFAWVAPTIALGGCLAVVLLVASRLGAPGTGRAGGTGSRVERWWRPAVALGAAALLIGPLVWALQPLRHPTDGGDPRAGPALTRVDTAAEVAALGPALRWVEARTAGVRHPLALATTDDAGAWVVADGPVVGLGGFFGNEPLPPTTRLRQLIRSDAIGYVLVDPALSTPTTRLLRSMCPRQPAAQLPLVTADLLLRCRSSHLTVRGAAGGYPRVASRSTARPIATRKEGRHGW